MMLHQQNSQQGDLAMKHYTILIGQLKEQILRFGESISDGLTRPKMKFLAQMLYGLLVCQSVLLTDISRALQENILLSKTEDRLSRNLKDFYPDLFCVYCNYLDKVKPLVDADTIFCLDPGDICKKYGKSQEGLNTIIDGSSHEPALGWPVIGVTALTHGSKLPIPVYSEVLESADVMEDNLSEAITAAIRSLQRSFGGPIGVMAMDRATDDIKIYRCCLDTDQQFIIRAKTNRNLIIENKTVNINEAAMDATVRYHMKFKDKHGKEYKLNVGFLSVRLPDYPEKELSLIVVFGYEEGKPMLLMTNLPIQDKDSCLRVLKSYLCRWRIEECYRFIKTQFNLENIRVQSMASIRSLVFLVTILTGWIVMFANKQGHMLLVQEVLVNALRLNNIPNFLLYAVADGIKNIMKRATCGIAAILTKPPKSQQLSFFIPSNFSYSSV
jgi:hypothetical protein